MTRRPPQKLYCYIDETGQDTKGQLFVVSVVIAEGDHEELKVALAQIERTSGKGQRKWTKARGEQRLKYMRAVLKLPDLAGKLSYAIHTNTTDYLPRTVLTTARAITVQAEPNYKAVVLIDGLQKSQTRWFGAELRRLRIRTTKVRGVRKEEADILMRLADALAGFTRAALMEEDAMRMLLDKAKREGVVREL